MVMDVDSSQLICTFSEPVKSGAETSSTSSSFSGLPKPIRGVCVAFWE